MKKGAASFYIVAFSTLILMVIATSFAMVIMSEITRSMNDDLSQSAYDSALAGVEDAKVAYSNYRRCKEAQQSNSSIRAELSAGANVTCNDILYWMEQHPDCYMVARILGRIAKNAESEVELGGTQVTGGGGVTTTNQAYTCVIIDTKLNDYKATLATNNKVQTIKAVVGDGATNSVKKIKIGWYTVRNDMNDRLKYFNFNNNNNYDYSNSSNNRVTFGTSISLPPTLEVRILQTKDGGFSLGDFDIVQGNNTNRATLYLVPTKYKVLSDTDRYYHTDNNTLKPEQVAVTNKPDQTIKPYTIYCPSDASTEFYCEATIELPEPIGGGDRSNETFMISVALPYQQPDTDFSLSFYCGDGNASCGTIDGGNGATQPAMLKNTQISIDSTGRANDLFRRVETRLETSDTTYASGYPYYALEILGGDELKKNMTVYYEKKENCGSPGCFYF